MQMDGVHCGYYPRDHQGLGVVEPMSPPSTPTDDGSLPRCSSPVYSSVCEDQYQHHRYADTGYHNTQYSTGHDVADPYSPPESPMTSPKTSTHTSPMHHHLSSSRVTGDESENTYSDTYSSTKPSSRKSSSGNSEKKRTRKNSYVYDVRLPDEQFLFLVPDLDLVKSHLMFAVREEVEVLKEKITELMERINQLEYENTVLKQYATNEALQQIQQHHNSNT